MLQLLGKEAIVKFKGHYLVDDEYDGAEYQIVFKIKEEPEAKQTTIEIRTDSKEVYDVFEVGRTYETSMISMHQMEQLLSEKTQ